MPGGASGVLAYCPAGPTFDYFFDGCGLAANTGYSLIYYADPWPGNYPGALIASGATDGDGYIHLAGSAELNMDLPHPDDANTGAKIWLVPSIDYDSANCKMKTLSNSVSRYENYSEDSLPNGPEKMLTAKGKNSEGINLICQ